MKFNDQTVTYAGDKLTWTEDEKGDAVIRFDDKGIGRSCGACTLCCKLIPVHSMHKPANVKCQHAHYGKGCAIYPTRPDDCRTWSCRWMCDARTAGLPRPDRAHYVIDLTYDYVEQAETGGQLICIQIWVDPAFPDAHRDARLRAYLQHMANTYHVGAIIRWGSEKGMVLLAPLLNTKGEWLEIAGATRRSEIEHAMRRLPIHDREVATSAGR